MSVPPEMSPAKPTSVAEPTSSSSVITSGGHANRTGNRLELFVENALKEHGYDEFWNHKEQIFENRGSVGGKQYSKQVPVGETIYGGMRKADFLVVNKDKFPDGLLIECKWQQAAGTVYEKYPLLVFNILKTGVPTIVILDGGGYRKAAEAWFKDQANPERALIGVYSMAEFHKRVNNGLFGTG